MVDNLQVLKEARGLIQEGWTRGHYKRDGRYCAMGAIIEAVQNSDVESHQYITLVDMLTNRINEEGMVPLSRWNDEQKTKKPVLELFDDVIEEMENDDD